MGGRAFCFNQPEIIKISEQKRKKGNKKKTETKMKNKTETKAETKNETWVPAIRLHQPAPGSRQLSRQQEAMVGTGGLTEP